MKLKTKKIVTGLLSIMFLSMLVQPCFSKMSEDNFICPEEPFDTASPLSQGLQKVSGINLLATKFAESKIEKGLKENIDGDFDVKINSFSASDLKAGKLKSIALKGTNVGVKDLYASSVDVRTLCDFVSIDYKKSPIAILEPINIGIKGVITNDDIAKTMLSKSYKDNFSKMQLIKSILPVSFATPTASIVNDRFVLNTALQLKGLSRFAEFPISMNAALGITNKKIAFTDVKLNTGGVNMDIPVEIFNYANPILYNLISFEKDGIRVKITNLKMEDSKLNVEGIISVAKTKA